MEPERNHVTFAGLRLPDQSHDFRVAVELGFMWAHVRAFGINSDYQGALLICLDESMGHVAMEMGDVLHLKFHTVDACRGSQIHIVFEK